MVYENGGAAFIVAYIIMLAVLVIPLLTVEVALGQNSQKEFVSTLKGISSKLGTFVAWLVIFMLVAVCGYYGVVVAWGADFLFYSPNLGWGTDAQSFFFQDILNMSDDPSYFGVFSLPVVLGLIATYLGVYFSIFKGLKSVAAVVKWTVPLPFVLLIVLLINSFFLPGSTEGFRFIISPEWARLGDIMVWKNALIQAFFSAGVGFGVTVLYASFNNSKTDIRRTSLYIALGNFAVSLIAAFAIFGTLGWMAQQQGVPIDSVVTSGATLAFVTFPTALSQLPVGGNIFAIIFFVTLLSLAIDSLFALVETVGAAIKSNIPMFQSWRSEKFVGLLCLCLFVWSLAFTGQNGLQRLDVVDHYILGHVAFIAVILQTILIGWYFPASKLRAFINKHSSFQYGIWLEHLLKYVAPIILIGLYVSSLVTELNAGKLYGDYPAPFLQNWGIVPIVIVFFCALLTVFFVHKKHWLKK